MFASQHWYVVAMADEVTDAPFGRRVLDEPIVLYRLADGTPVALADQCPHRRYPLSLGRPAPYTPAITHAADARTAAPER